MEKIIKVVFLNSEVCGDCIYDNYQGDDGKVYFAKYQLVGWYTEDNEPVGDDVEMEIDG